MADNKTDAQGLPDWWEREKQRRQLRFLILLGFLLALIAFFYYVSALGRTGIVNGITFDTSNHIAFVRQDADGTTSLYTIRADGTESTRLTPANDRSDKSAPAWTIDGSRLLYASNRQDSKKTQIYILGAGEPTQLTYGPERKDSPLALPDGKRAAFITQGAIKTVYLNGEEVTQILPEPREGNANSSDLAAAGQTEPIGPYLSATFSSDGSNVAGVQELSAENGVDVPGISGGDQIARALPYGAQRTAVLDSGRYVSTAWDAKGERLLVSYAERLVMNPQTQKPIGYASGLTLWTFTNPNSPTEQRMLVNMGLGFTPRNISWSPDGKLVACEAWFLKSEGVRELRGITMLKVPDSSQPTQYTRDAQSKDMPLLSRLGNGVPSNPKWSPDGSRLLFQVMRPDHKSDLWVVNSDFTNALNLTKGVGDNTQAVWSPAHAK